jgi:hypothetical protein
MHAAFVNACNPQISAQDSGRTDKTSTVPARIILHRAKIDIIARKRIEC